MKIVSRNTDTLAGLIFFCASLWLLWETQKFATSQESIRAIGPQVFPNTISGTMCILSILLFIKGLGRKEEALWKKGTFWRDVGMILVIILCATSYIYLLEYMGIILWMFCFLLVMQYCLGERSIKKILFVALSVTAIIYGIFGMGLNIIFPSGIWAF